MTVEKLIMEIRKNGVDVMDGNGLENTAKWI